MINLQIAGDHEFSVFYKQLINTNKIWAGEMRQEN